ncbi:hypothetical protein [Bacillus sp. EB01]|uniref:hypothetical protein n=1 Tax=Bacillus sp. EB01 TaxID=1347086 RepID=UPI0005C6EA2D|nr:hypothetical protein [Bacillus sp. EB01]
MMIIREYHEKIHIEDAFAAFQKARLNIYRLNEIENYITEKGYHKESGWKYWKSKIDLRRKEFDQLEARVGIKILKPIDSVTKVTFREMGDVKNVINLIKKYLVLNYKIEKTVLSILKSLISLLKDRHIRVLQLLEQVYDGYARYLREIKINNINLKLNRVSTDEDKIITYEITTKEQKLKRFLNALTENQLMFKIRDNDALIIKEYEELDRYEKLLSTIISNNMDIIDKLEKDKSENINQKGNIYNWVLAGLAFIFVIYSAITDTISIFQNEGYKLKQIIWLMFKSIF